MHTHARLHVVATMGVLRDLQDTAVVAHGVVVTDHTHFLDTEDIGQVGANEGYEGAARLAGWNLETPIVGGQVAALQETIGRFHGADAGESQLLRQAVLQGAEQPLAATPGSGE